MTRRASNRPYVRWLVNIDKATAERIDLLLLDPLAGRTAYGARSALINQLLNEYLDQELPPPTNEEPSS